VEKIGVQRTPGANPEMYKSDDYSVHLKGDNQTPMQQEREVAGQSCLHSPVDSTQDALPPKNMFATKPHQPVLM